MPEKFRQAATCISNADAILIAAGAGMGVDSGLPDFRGNEGFWKAYPPFAARGLSFAEVANPRWFEDDPELAWGFYGHRLNLYRASTPHPGFGLLSQFIKDKESFVFTSNVDGHFQKAGFDESKIVEIHGAIEYLQCSVPCCEEIWRDDNLRIEIDEETFRAIEPLPHCPRCHAVARPNILMFDDGCWIWNRTRDQETRFDEWLSMLAGKEMVVIEIGAGTAIPSVRRQSENLHRYGASLIRINPRESDGPPGTISLESGALEGLTKIADEFSLLV